MESKLLHQFPAGVQCKQTDNDRMDALAITPVCLSIALAIDYKLVPSLLDFLAQHVD